MRGRQPRQAEQIFEWTKADVFKAGTKIKLMKH